MRPVSWYHIWTGDHYHSSRWLLAFEDHFGRMINAGFDGDVKVGIVGGLPQRAEALSYLRGWWPESEVVVQADEGFEQVTIDKMHAWCKTVDPATPVYYAHTKGALHHCEMNTQWRNAMDDMLVVKWQDRVKDLETYDAVGLHWLTHEEYPQHIDPRAPMFGGNFWWANAGYLAGLERVRGTEEFPPVNRWAAEGWMGRGFPRVKDLKPHWPQYPNG